MKLKLLLAITLFYSISTIAQIKGTVTDSKEQPLPFVNIYIENTYTGTTSNQDGVYELNVNKTGSYTVVFQFLGYKTVKKELLLKPFLSI